VWVLAVIESCQSWKLVNAIVANVEPPMVQSEIYPAGNTAGFVAVLTAIPRVQAHPGSQERTDTRSKSRYDCL